MDVHAPDRADRHQHIRASPSLPGTWTTEGEALKEAYQWEAKSQWRGAPLKDDLAVSVRFFFRTKRKADLDNFNNLWQDALPGIVYDDDCQMAELHLYRDYDRGQESKSACNPLRKDQLTDERS